MPLVEALLVEEMSGVSEFGSGVDARRLGDMGLFSTPNGFPFRWVWFIFSLPRSLSIMFAGFPHSRSLPARLNMDRPGVVLFLMIRYQGLFVRVG